MQVSKQSEIEKKTKDELLKGIEDKNKLWGQARSVLFSSFETAGPDTGFFIYCFPTNHRDTGALASGIVRASHYTGSFPYYLATADSGTYAYIYCLLFRGGCIVSFAYYILSAGQDTLARC